MIQPHLKALVRNMMEIRQAERYDIDVLVDFMRSYSQSSPLIDLRDRHDEYHVRRLITAIVIGEGLCFIADRDSEPAGMIMGIRQPNVWNPSIKIMHELAWWVDPCHRGSSAGYRLLKTYVDECNLQMAQHRISAWTVSRMPSSPDIDYGRWGAQKIEEIWACQQP